MTSRQRRLTAWLAPVLAGALLGLGLVLATTGGHRSPGPAAASGSATVKVATAPAIAGTRGAASGRTVTVSSTSTEELIVGGAPVTGLAPGVTRPATVTVTNPTAQAVRLLTVSIAVGDASRSCLASSNITTTAYRASVPGARSYWLPAAGGSARVALSIGMRDLAVNQDACKRAVFPLTFRATAVSG